jgi:hypothetical protein
MTTENITEARLITKVNARGEKRRSADNECYVYGLFRGNGEIFYIGKGSNGRVLVHFKKSNNVHVQRIINSDKNVYFKIIDWNLSHDVAYELEALLVEEIGRSDLKQGPLVNFTQGGKGTKGWIPDEVEIKRRSDYRKKNPPILSEESKKRISETLKARAKKYDNSFKGKKHSDLTKKQMSINHANFSLWRHPKAKKNLWVKSLELYDIWLLMNKPNAHMMCIRMEVKYENTYMSIVNKFKEGWVPKEDYEFLDWYKATKI